MLNQRLEVCISHIRRDCISEKGWLKKERQCVNISIPKQAFVGLGLRREGNLALFKRCLVLRMTVESALGKKETVGR